MAKAPIDIRSLARAHTEIAIKVLAGIAKDGTNESARVSAAAALLDRGWGKPSQTRTNEDGESQINVVIRHITQPLGEPRAAKIIEHEDKPPLLPPEYRTKLR
jgi:hypothetical protein